LNTCARDANENPFACLLQKIGVTAQSAGRAQKYDK